MSLITDAIRSKGILFKAYGPEDHLNFVDLNDYLGLAFILKDQPVILVQKEMSPIQQRFVAAHELGHILLGHVDNGKASRGQTSYDIELEADLFAVIMMAIDCAMEQVEARLKPWFEGQSRRQDTKEAAV